MSQARHIEAPARVGGRRPLHILIVGAGISGLCLAQGLVKAGISAAVYERDPSARFRSQGYLSWTMPLPDPRLRTADATALHGAATETVRSFHPAVRRIVARADVPATFSLCVTSARPVAPWRSPVVTLLGDAIHTMSPGRGDGGSIALKDAGRLCRALVEVAAGRAGLCEAKAAYETEMLDYGFQAVADSLSRPFAPRPRPGGMSRRHVG